MHGVIGGGESFDAANNLKGADTMGNKSAGITVETASFVAFVGYEQKGPGVGVRRFFLELDETLAGKRSGTVIEFRDALAIVKPMQDGDYFMVAGLSEQTAVPAFMAHVLATVRELHPDAKNLCTSVEHGAGLGKQGDVARYLVTHPGYREGRQTFYGRFVGLAIPQKG